MPYNIIGNLEKFETTEQIITINNKELQLVSSQKSHNGNTFPTIYNKRILWLNPDNSNDNGIYTLTENSFSPERVEELAFFHDKIIVVEEEHRLVQIDGIDGTIISNIQFTTDGAIYITSKQIYEALDKQQVINCTAYIEWSDETLPTTLPSGINENELVFLYHKTHNYLTGIYVSKLGVEWHRSEHYTTGVSLYRALINVSNHMLIKMNNAIDIGVGVDPLDFDVLLSVAKVENNTDVIESSTSAPSIDWIQAKLNALNTVSANYIDDITITNSKQAPTVDYVRSFVNNKVDNITISGGYDDTEIRTLINDETLARSNKDTEIEVLLADNTTAIANINEYDDTEIRTLINDETLARSTKDAEITTKVDNNISDITYLKNKQNDFTDDITTINNSVDNNNFNIKALKTDVETITSNNNQQNTDITTINSKVNTLEQTSTNHTDKISALENVTSDIDVIKSETDRNTQDIANLHQSDHAQDIEIALLKTGIQEGSGGGGGVATGKVIVSAIGEDNIENNTKGGAYKTLRFALKNQTLKKIIELIDHVEAVIDEQEQTYVYHTNNILIIGKFGIPLADFIAGEEGDADPTVSLETSTSLIPDSVLTNGPNDIIYINENTAYIGGLSSFVNVPVVIDCNNSLFIKDIIFTQPIVFNKVVGKIEFRNCDLHLIFFAFMQGVEETAIINFMSCVLPENFELNIPTDCKIELNNINNTFALKLGRNSIHLDVHNCPYISYQTSKQLINNIFTDEYKSDVRYIASDGSIGSSGTLSSVPSLRLFIVATYLFEYTGTIVFKKGVFASEYLNNNHKYNLVLQGNGSTIENFTYYSGRGGSLTFIDFNLSEFSVSNVQDSEDILSVKFINCRFTDNAYVITFLGFIRAAFEDCVIEQQIQFSDIPSTSFSFPIIITEEQQKQIRLDITNSKLYNPGNIVLNTTDNIGTVCLKHSYIKGRINAHHLINTDTLIRFVAIRCEFSEALAYNQNVLIINSTDTTLIDCNINDIDIQTNTEWAGDIKFIHASSGTIARPVVKFPENDFKGSNWFGVLVDGKIFGSGDSGNGSAVTDGCSAYKSPYFNPTFFEVEQDNANPPVFDRLFFGRNISIALTEDGTAYGSGYLLYNYYDLNTKQRWLNISEDRKYTDVYMGDGAWASKAWANSTLYYYYALHGAFLKDEANQLYGIGDNEAGMLGTTDSTTYPSGRIIAMQNANSNMDGYTIDKVVTTMHNRQNFYIARSGTTARIFGWGWGGDGTNINLNLFGSTNYSNRTVPTYIGQYSNVKDIVAAGSVICNQGSSSNFASNFDLTACFSILFEDGSVRGLGSNYGALANNVSSEYNYTLAYAKFQGDASTAGSGTSRKVKKLYHFLTKWNKNEHSTFFGRHYRIYTVVIADDGWLYHSGSSNSSLATTPITTYRKLESQIAGDTADHAFQGNLTEDNCKIFYHSDLGFSNSYDGTLYVLWGQKLYAYGNSITMFESGYTTRGWKRLNSPKGRPIVDVKHVCNESDGDVLYCLDDEGVIYKKGYSTTFFYSESWNHRSYNWIECKIDI